MSQRALRLHEKHSKAELVAMADRVKADPSSQQTGDLHLFTTKARRLLDDIGWAIYWHDRPQGNTRMQGGVAQSKFW